MKTILISVLLSVLTFSFAFAQKKVEIDPASSKFVWTGKKVTGSHTGGITLSSGSLVLKGEKIDSGEFTMNMNSMTCTDLEGEWADKLIGHLKSDDFFSTEKNPTSTLKINSVKTSKTGKGEVKADLTIKGKTFPVVFPVTIERKGNELLLTGKVSVDRTKYEIRYGSSSFFDNLGDKAIDNIFTIDFEISQKM